MYQNKDKCLPGTSADSAPCTRRQIFAFFAGDRALAVSNNKVYYVPGTSASVFRVPKTEKNDQVHFSILNLAGECTWTGKMLKLAFQVQMSGSFKIAWWAGTLFRLSAVHIVFVCYVKYLKKLSIGSHVFWHREKHMDLRTGNRLQATS